MIPKALGEASRGSDGGNKAGDRGVKVGCDRMLDVREAANL